MKLEQQWCITRRCVVLMTLFRSLLFIFVLLANITLQINVCLFLAVDNMLRCHPPPFLGRQRPLLHRSGVHQKADDVAMFGVFHDSSYCRSTLPPTPGTSDRTVRETSPQNRRATTKQKLRSLCCLSTLRSALMTRQHCAPSTSRDPTAPFIRIPQAHTDLTCQARGSRLLTTRIG